MTQRLYYFWDLVKPAWDFIKLYGTFHGQVKKWKIVNYLQWKEQGHNRTNLERMMAYIILGENDEKFDKKCETLLQGLKEIVDNGISINSEKIIANEIHRQKCDNFAHVYSVLGFLKNNVTMDDVLVIALVVDMGAEGIMEDMKMLEKRL